ncbi:IS66 family transposase [Bradyrhizobium sp. USDA 4011]
MTAADRLFMDETTAPVLDPGRRPAKKGFFWAMACDDRGHVGQGPPIVLFRSAPGRSGEHPSDTCSASAGGSYEGCDLLTRIERPQGPWALVHCWSYLRRRIVKLTRNTKSRSTRPPCIRSQHCMLSRRRCAPRCRKSGSLLDDSTRRRLSPP